VRLANFAAASVDAKTSDILRILANGFLAMYDSPRVEKLQKPRNLSLTIGSKAGWMHYH